MNSNPNLTFKIMHQNVASILSKQSLLELTLQELREIDIEPDVICLTETFLKEGYGSYLRVTDFKLAATFCREKCRGGSCILIKKDMSYIELTCLRKYATQKVFEVCGVEIPYYKLVVIALYRTPTSDPCYNG